MKPEPSLVLLALLLVPGAWGLAGGRQAPRAMPRSHSDAAALGARGSSWEYQKVKPGSEFPWILAYVPIRSCHRVLKDKYGEFSPPAYHDDSPMNFWCNWTIWAGSRKHIIIYIQDFTTKESCNKNEDKILFEGVSSLAENSVVYACWKKELHVFATFAQAVHVVLLKRHLPNCKETRFKGKYYLFQDHEGESSPRDDMISETPAPKLPKQDRIFQTGWAEDLRDVLGFATTRSTVSPDKTAVLSGGSLRGRGSTLGPVGVGSPAEFVPYEGARTPLLETEAPCVLGSELRGGLGCCKEARGRGTPVGITPTAAQGTWGQSLSVSVDITVGFGYMDRLSSVLLETPLLGALQVVEPLLQPAGVGLENRQSVLPPALRPKDLGDPLSAVKPTHTGCLDLAAHLQSLFPGRGESKESTDTTVCQGLCTVSSEQDEIHPQLSVLPDGTVGSDAGGLAQGLMPSLRSPYEVVDGDHSHLPPERSQRCQSSFGDLSTNRPELETTGLQCMGISPLESFRGFVEGKTVLHPTAPLDILQEHPRLHGQSSHILQPAPADHGSLPQTTQVHDHPAAETTCVSSLGGKSCCHQSDRAARPRLVTPPLPTGLKHPPTVMSTLVTETTPMLVASCTEPVPADFGSLDFTPEAQHPPEVGSASRVVFSLPAALDLDPDSLRQRAGISLASPGEQERVSPSPPCHPSAASELGTDGSSGHTDPGMQELVLGEVGDQQGETSVSMGWAARGPSPASVLWPGLGLPQPEVHVSSGSEVAPVSLPGTWEATREEHVVPMRHQGTAASDKVASASILGGFKVQKTAEALRVGAEEQRSASSSNAPAHPGPPVAWQGEAVWSTQKPQEPSDAAVPRNTWVPGGQQQKRAELGPPWTVEYFPVSSCHLTFRNGSGMFYLPLHADIKTNIWCNWTIWAGPQQHIVIYVQGLQGSEGCGKNQDKMIFRGVSSNVETQVVYACHNRGTLIFAAQATAVHVLFISGSGPLSSEYGHFKGQYYVFRDSETMGSSNDTTAPQEPVQEVSEKESWRTVVTKALLPTPRASLGPSAVPAASRIQPRLVSPDGEAQHPPSLVEDAQSGGTEGRQTKDDVLVEPAPAGQDTERTAEPSALEIAKGGGKPVVTTVPCCSVGGSSSEAPSSNVGLSAGSSSLDRASDSLSEVAAAARHTQTPVLEEPLPNRSTKPSLYPFPGVTAGDTVSLGERNEELFGLVSVLAALENDTALQSQHHPGDVLFEVTIEIKPKDWIPHGGNELQKDLLASMKNHIQENLKLSASRVNEMKLKEIKRTSNATLLLTFWLHLKAEERNVSLLLQSQLEELLGPSGGAEKLQLVSLLVEDVNECRAGVSLCGQEAECFNGVGTYLCRCKMGYEDHSPTQAGTLCIHAPQSGISVFLRHADILVGAAITACLVMLVAAGTMCRRHVARWARPPRRNLNPEEPPARAVEEPVMELHDLGECLRLDPFQLKLRARTPEWLWGIRAHPGQTYQAFLEQHPLL